MNYTTIDVRFQPPVCFIQFNRPEANNTINAQLIEECGRVLEECEFRKDEESITVVVLEGLPDVFCFGADFKGILDQPAPEETRPHDPEPLYDLWLKLATGPFVSISHVPGKVNAGGVGFVAASDIVLADTTAVFSLSELLFGLFPACVLPFLIRKIGFQNAHYLTLMTRPFFVEKAVEWGLVDAVDTTSDTLLRHHLLRLRYLSKKGISSYKAYMNQLVGLPLKYKSMAIQANKQVFSDPDNMAGILRYLNEGLFPWEKE